ncbi:MAG: Polyketide cyclase / dehydrase and lipid transport [Modestobacter sp.]|nr:Polyketide cyclase / dehydrase and lipid transport [Modestobacter sp.]
MRAPAERVRAALADYDGTRRRMLTEQFSEYRVTDGGDGTVARVHWKLAATTKRVRDQDVVVTATPDGGLVESDANSSMVTTWTVHPAEAGVSTVRVRSSWDGATGIGGFFERTFAPKGLRRIHEGLIGRLDAELSAG